MTTDELLQNAKALSAAASPGPWTTQKDLPFAFSKMDGGVESTPVGECYGKSGCAEKNAAFIAASREMVPALVAEIERLREALKPFASIANMEERQESGASVMVNINRCRAARQALTGEKP